VKIVPDRNEKDGIFPELRRCIGRGQNREATEIGSPVSRIVIAKRQRIDSDFTEQIHRPSAEDSATEEDDTILMGQ
jgi:hypothetical protein